MESANFVQNNIAPATPQNGNPIFGLGSHH